MGQCYSVDLKIKLKDADAFVRLTREFADANGWSQDYKDELTGINGIINFIVGDGSVDVHYENGFPVFRGEFDASYSWDSVLENWFGAVAPSLEDGSEIEVAPDEGLWKCVVRDGAASDREYDENWVDDYESEDEDE